MSLQAVQSYAVPEDTARIARTIFPQGSPVMRMRDELHMIMEDRDFSDLMLDAWLQATEESREQAFDALGQRLDEARQSHEGAKALDEGLRVVTPSEAAAG